MVAVALKKRTRSGDLEPAVVSYLVRQEGGEAQQVEQGLNERSGLLGFSGRSPDMIDLLFFFSSRRRHTRSLRDWSSDVCSSDLGGGIDKAAQGVAWQRVIVAA